MTSLFLFFCFLCFFFSLTSRRCSHGGAVGAAAARERCLPPTRSQLHRWFHRCFLLPACCCLLPAPRSHSVSQVSRTRAIAARAVYVVVAVLRVFVVNQCILNARCCLCSSSDTGTVTACSFLYLSVCTQLTCDLFESHAVINCGGLGEFLKPSSA